MEYKDRIFDSSHHFIGSFREINTIDMKLLVVFCLIAVVAAAPAGDQNVQILRLENENFLDGSYKFGFEQTDGTRQDQQGVLRNAGTDDEYIEVTGTYSWVGPDGVTYLVKYTAGEEGYKPEIEQGPGGGVPPAVIASLLG